MPGTFPLQRALAAALLGLAAVLGCVDAHAGTIGFRTDAEVKAVPGVDAKITMTHTGDEAAEEVSVSADLDGKVVDGEQLPAMSPNESHVWNFHLADETPRGVYAIVLRARYSDTNGYPFEVVSLANVNVGVQPATRIFGSLDVPPLAAAGGEGTATLVAKRPPERTGDYEVRLVTPSGIEAPAERVKLQFNPQGRATATFRLKNTKLLTGTTVNIYGFVYGAHDGVPQTDVIRGTVRIASAPTRSSPPKFYRWAAGVFALLLVLEAVAWATGRRSRRDNDPAPPAPPTVEEKA
jgi:hypothetical protein